jgi:hypothetical protein
MANGDVDVTEGAGLKVGTYTISEDAATRHLQRVVLNTSAGAEITSAALGQADAANSSPVVLNSDYVPPGTFLDDAAFTAAVSRLHAIGAFADETATDSVDEGDIGAPRMTLDRKMITTPQPHTAGGLSIFRSLDLDEGTLEVVKNAAGQLYGGWVTNTATDTRWIKFYNATSGTVGTGTPVITVGIPGNSSDDIGAILGAGGMGIAFATGICVGASTAAADADTGAPGAGDVVINLFYK